MAKEDMVHIYNGVSLSHKKEQNNAMCSSMDGPRDYHTSEVRQAGKDKYHRYCLCVGSKQHWYKYLFTEWNGVTDVESKPRSAREERRGRDTVSGCDRHRPLCVRDANRDPLSQHRGLHSNSLGIHTGEESKRGSVCIANALCCTLKLIHHYTPPTCHQKCF